MLPEAILWEQDLPTGRPRATGLLGEGRGLERSEGHGGEDRLPENEVPAAASSSREQGWSRVTLRERGSGPAFPRRGHGRDVVLGKLTPRHLWASVVGESL